MAVIENFSLLSKEGLKTFAESLIKKINANNIFSDDDTFILDPDYSFDEAVYADEKTGDLEVLLTTDNPVICERSASWTDSDYESAYDNARIGSIDSPDFDNTIDDDLEKAFKTLTAEVDGYRLTLRVDGVSEYNYEGAEIEDISSEDGGIGSYEYWGYRGYDSDPYVDVYGTIYISCTASYALSIEPII